MKPQITKQGQNLQNTAKHFTPENSVYNINVVFKIVSIIADIRIEMFRIEKRVERIFSQTKLPRYTYMQNMLRLSVNSIIQK